MKGLKLSPSLSCVGIGIAVIATEAGFFKILSISMCLISASSYGFNLYSSPAYDVISSDRSAFAIPPPSSAYRTLTQDNTQVKPEDTHGCIDGSLCTTVNDREGSRTSELCLETSLQQCTSLSTLTPVPVEHNSSEEELWRINWNSQRIAPHASNSSEEEELCEEVIIGRPRPSSSGRFFPAAVTSDVNPVKLPVSRRISDTSFKRKAFLISSNCDSSAVILRPNLDFDKMRVSLMSTTQHAYIINCIINIYVICKNSMFLSLSSDGQVSILIQDFKFSM